MFCSNKSQQTSEISVKGEIICIDLIIVSRKNLKIIKLMAQQKKIKTIK